jgi:hypothetical protein
MANDVTGGVWRIDTAPFTTGNGNRRVKITNFNIGDSTSGDHIVVNDLNGKTLVDYVSNGAQYRIGPLGWVNGVVVPSGGLGSSSVLEIAVGAGK